MISNWGGIVFGFDSAAIFEVVHEIESSLTSFFISALNQEC